jgi:protease-4
MAREKVAAAAEGRVWTGRQAYPLGLIDHVGGLEEAFDQAKRLAGIAAHEPVLVERYPRPRRWWMALWRRSGPETQSGSLRPWLDFVTTERIWAVMPFQIRFF